MSEMQARLDAIRRWQDWRGSGFPAGDKDGLVVVTELVRAIVLGDALAAELLRVPATPLPEPRLWKLWRRMGLMK